MSDAQTREHRLIRIQAVSGLVFAAFLLVHLANTAAGALGQTAYDGFQAFLRGFYHVPPVEVAVIGVAGLVHAGVGVRRALRRRARRRLQRAQGKSPPPVPAWLRLHRASGWFLLLVVVGHVLATRGPGLFVGMPADFAYLTFSLRTWPAVMFPYYALLFGCGAFHLLHGSLVALRVLGLSASPPTAAWTRVALGTSLAAGLAGILAMGGLLGEVDTARFDEFRAFYERYLPFMVTWR